MTVNTTTSSVIILGNGSNTTFTFSFAVQPDPTTIVVYLLDSLGNPTLLNPSVYTLTLNSPVTGQLWGYGGTVTYPLVGSPITNSYSIQISRNTPTTQETSLSNQGNFYPQTVEQGLDLLEMQTQELVAGTTYTFPTPFTPASFDPAGAAAGILSAAETFASNASNLSSGTVPVACLPIATTVAFGAVKPDGTTIKVTGGTISAPTINGIAVVGTPTNGQVLQYNATNSDYEPITPSSSSTITLISTNSVINESTSGHAMKGNLLTPVINQTLIGVIANIYGNNNDVYKAKVYSISGTSTIVSQIGTATYTFGSTVTFPVFFKFASPLSLIAGTTYAIVIEISSGTTTTACQIDGAQSGIFLYPGFKDSNYTDNSIISSSVDPANGITLSTTTGVCWCINLVTQG
jgi:hypothetical protein